MAALLGHARTRARLWDALARDALHHAYLFEGPRGVGKRTVADALAQAANCVGVDDLREAPCGTCAPCQQIAAGTHPDVLTLEPDPARAAQLIRVDQVRELIRRTSYHRYGSRRRTIVVDPVEAMQDSAANALLKTLEEPPAGTGFLLVCTNAAALLPTIMSRCQRVRFGAVPEPEITAWLTARGVDDAERAARMSLGCPGVALGLAEGGLDARDALRSELLGILAGDLQQQYTWSAKLCDGKRPVWTARVLQLLEIVEDLVRDAAVVGAGSSQPLLHPDDSDTAEAWARALWPTGIAACHRALEEAREDLIVFVSGKTLVDAVVTRLRHELGGRSYSSSGT